MKGVRPRASSVPVSETCLLFLTIWNSKSFSHACGGGGGGTKSVHSLNGGGGGGARKVLPCLEVHWEGGGRKSFGLSIGRKCSVHETPV